MDGIQDDYSTENQTIIHKRTKTLDFSSKYEKQLLNKHRKELKN